MNNITLIADHYGMEAQSRQTIEEMAELTQALSKFWRYTGDAHETFKRLRCDIAEEIADVEIMLEQLKYLYDINRDVDNWKKEKIKRQLKRMEEKK